MEIDISRDSCLLKPDHQKEPPFKHTHLIPLTSISISTLGIYLVWPPISLYLPRWPTVCDRGGHLSTAWRLGPKLPSRLLLIMASTNTEASPTPPATAFSPFFRTLPPIFPIHSWFPGTSTMNNDSGVQFVAARPRKVGFPCSSLLEAGHPWSCPP